MEKDTIRIGTRGSKLALIQTNMVIDVLKQQFPNLRFETVIIRTLGDKILDKPLQEIGGKGLFISELEEAMIKGEIDLAVHSAKDMPEELPQELGILGVLKREDPRDVLITRATTTLNDLPSIVIGTSSQRRQTQIEELYHNADCRPLRGNVDTRLRKLSEGEYDGIILAAAGIKRLQLDHEENFNYRYLEISEMIPAAGQGIIAIEGKKEGIVSELVKAVSDKTAELELRLERKALELFMADCHEPVGVYSKVDGEEVTLWMMKRQNGIVKKLVQSTTMEKRWDLTRTMVEQISEEIT
ncbi:MAG: porphobilinogen deaminase [Herbinix sp.]|jgi:hydroxymethylbilane synthase|nr:porphobilinogen deaminase [Herbinix sp.]